jgi:hypothetical protein
LTMSAPYSPGNSIGPASTSSMLSAGVSRHPSGLFSTAADALTPASTPGSTVAGPPIVMLNGGAMQVCVGLHAAARMRRCRWACVARACNTRHPQPPLTSSALHVLHHTHRRTRCSGWPR